VNYTAELIEAISFILLTDKDYLLSSISPDDSRVFLQFSNDPKDNHSISVVGVLVLAERLWFCIFKFAINLRP
jgi:hypothetical protein